MCIIIHVNCITVVGGMCIIIHVNCITVVGVMRIIIHVQQWLCCALGLAVAM